MSSTVIAFVTPSAQAEAALARRPTMRPCRVRSTSTWSGVTRCHVEAVRHKTLKAYSLRSGKVEAIEVHHLGPGPDEVLDELRLRIRASVNLRQGPELGVRTEDEIDTRAGPLDLARLAIAPFEHVLGVRCRLPLRAHVEQVHEEVVGQRFRPLGKDAVFRLSEVGVQGAHAADENRHLGRGQRQQLRPIDQQLLGWYGVLAPEVVSETIRDRLEDGG